MGNTRSKPARLAEKLRQIRLALGLTQSEMVNLLRVEDLTDYTRISGFETGIREPTLTTLLQYARIANVHMETLVDDELDLPINLPSPTKSEGLRRASAPRKKKR